jgi:hypothetical protein
VVSVVVPASCHCHQHELLTQPLLLLESWNLVGSRPSFPIKSQSSKSQSEDAGSTFPLFPASSLGTKYSYHHIVLDLDLSQDNNNHTLSLSLRSIPTPASPPLLGLYHPRKGPFEPA